MINYDFIGDIHGHADELEALLTKLGYIEKNGVYQHLNRKVFFVGDFIDRGPKIRRVLQIVKAMCDFGSAKTVMGNHEYNALCFHTKNEQGDYLRPHSEKNIRQHKATLAQFENHQKEWNDYLQWFMTLPLYYEQEEFRVVHACWDNNSIDYLKEQLQNNRLTLGSLKQSANNENELFEIVETTLKGKEIELPNGLTFHDKDGTERHDIRIKWWLNALETTFREYSIIDITDLPNHNKNLHEVDYYLETEKPVFFGHYWLNGQPNLYRSNICCLDYSVAKEGKLVAYRYSGEPELNNENFVFV